MAAPRNDNPPTRLKAPSYPLFLALWGVPGTGKTTEILYVLYCWAMRKQAKVAAQPNGIASFETASGLQFPPGAVEVFERADQAAAFMLSQKGKLKGIGHDDGTAMLDESYAAHEAKAAEDAKRENRKPDGFYAPREIKLDVNRLKTAGRFAGAHVLCTYHEQSGSMKKDMQTGEEKYIKGGTKVPNKELVNHLLGALDVSLRAVPDITAKPFPGCYYYKLNDPKWAVKDRVFGMCDLKTPMNLAELMRHRNIEVPRHPDVKTDLKMESFVQDLATDCWRSGKDAEVIGEVVGLLVGELGPQYADWTVRDATSRVAIWRKASQHSSPEAAMKARWGLK